MGNRSAAVKKAWVTRKRGASFGAHGLPKGASKSDWRFAYRMASRSVPHVRAARLARIKDRLAIRKAKRVTNAAANTAAYMQMMTADLPGKRKWGGHFGFGRGIR